MSDQISEDVIAAVAAVKKPPKPQKSVVLDAVIAGFGIDLRMNLFTARPEIRMPGVAWRELRDSDEARIRDEMARRDASVFPQVVSDRLTMMAWKHLYHPVREYLESLSWDGTPRIETWLTKYLGVADSPYTRRAGEAMLRAAVRRVYQPGCKFDSTVILIGDEGSGKSTSVKLLCPRPEWFSESLPMGASPKLTIEGTEGVWIIESPEIVTTKDVGKVKDFLSRSTDGPTRRAYGHHSEMVPRQFVVFGTTNEDRPIFDETGMRRFWPMKTGALRRSWLENDRDQLWAEATNKELVEDHTWQLYMPAEVSGHATRAQSQFAVVDEWVATIGSWLSAPDTHHPIPGKVLVEDIWKELDISHERRTAAHSTRLNNAMKKLGYMRATDPIFVEARKRKCPYFYKLMPFMPEAFKTDLATADEVDRIEAEVERAIENGAVVEPLEYDEEG